MRVSVCALVVAITSAANAQFSHTLQYDAGNGSLPTAQCWDFNGATSPAPQVVNGELLTGPAAVSLTQFYDHELLYDFDRDTILRV